MARILKETHPHPDYPTLHLDLRTDSRFYQARAYLDRVVRLKSTKATSLSTAFRIAEDWYRRELRALTRKPVERLAANPTVAEVFASYRERKDEAQRLDAEKRWGPTQHFWRTILVSEITPQTYDDFIQWRRKRFKSIKAHTLHKDMVLIRQVLKLAVQRGHISTIPPMPNVGRILPNPRPWLSKAEWGHLRYVAEKRVEDAVADGAPRVARQRQDAYEFACFMVASMCRVDELRALRFHHCQLEVSGRRKILRCEFKGKTGMRVAYASPEAATIYAARLKRCGADAGALVFAEHHRDAFRELLVAAKLYTDHFGNRRNYKAMRATSIALALLRPNPPTIFQIARNAGTSVAIIESFYVKRLTSESGKEALTDAEPLHGVWGRKR